MTLADRLFRHPYLYSGSVLAKAATLLASLIWAVLIVTTPGAMAVNPNYQHLLHVIPNEDVWGWLLIALLLPMIWRIYSCSRPRWYGVAGYAVLALFWAYQWWGFLILEPVRSSAIATTSSLMLLSLYAFVSNPRSECPTCGVRPDGVCPLTGKFCGNARRFDEQRYQGD